MSQRLRAALLGFAAAALGVCLASLAHSDSTPLFQSGPMSPGNVPKFCTNGLLCDSGVLASNIAVDPARNSGRIVMYPSASWTSDPTSTVAFTVQPPIGVNVPCISTQSQCLVEAGAVAEAKGLSLDIYCMGEQIGGAQYPFIAMAVPFDTGALVQRYIHGHACNITFSTAVTGAALTINTLLDGGYFWWDGQIVSTYNTPSESTSAVRIRPSTCPPNEGCAAIVAQNGFIRIGAAVMGASVGATPHGAVVLVDVSVGSVSSMPDIWIGEINGCGPCQGPVAHDGFRVSGGSPSRGFFRNRLTIGYTHNVVTVLDLGSTDNTDTAHPFAYGHNDIVLLNASPGATNGECAIIASDLNKLNIASCNNDTLDPSKFDNAVTFTTNAHQNDVDVRAAGYSHTINTFLGAATFPIVDSGGTNSYSVNGTEIQKWGGLVFCDGASSYPGLVCAGGGAPPPGAFGVRNYLPILSFSAGAGATAFGNATNSFGAITVGGAGAQLTVTINFSGAGFLRTPGCFGTSSAGFMQVTAVSPTSVTLTASAAMAAGTLVYYQCSTLL